MALPLFIVDAFTDRPFAGNPAAVCLLPAWKDEHWLKAVAAEMNLSETAFLVKKADNFELRWFTPKVEVDLCGHATLASAHIIWQQGLANIGDEIRFATKSGTLKAHRHGDDIELDFPLKAEEAAEAPPGLAEALGVQPVYVGKNQFDYLVEVPSEAELRSLTPDFKRLAAVPVRGTIVTSRSADPAFDFVSRFFAPGAGIDEDPVTGSAHCCLATFWRKRLGKSEFIAYQASARGGVVKVRVVNDRALLAGKAITVVQGQLTASLHE
ncbi:MAG TPA: PhzF family phenazine biosynthesis protein [Gemmataceae bacterium]|nr:PhzF family phenazine biosynthesis protein [Gemmataceae bacterium]